MITLPRWVLRTFDESFCPHCEKKEVKTKLDRDGVYRIGLTEDISKKTKKMRLFFFFEHRCKICNKAARFAGFPTYFEEFIGDMIEISNSPLQDAITESNPTKQIIENKGNTLGKKEKEVEGISDAELQSFKQVMNDTVYFEDFLDKIGITKAERDQIKEEYKNEPEDK